MACTSPMGSVMGLRLKVSTSTLATRGDRKPGSVGPKRMPLTPSDKSANRTATAFCSYQAMSKEMGRSLMSETPKTSLSLSAMTASE